MSKRERKPQPCLIAVDAGQSGLIEVRPGDWLVSDLKAAVGVPAHKLLARIDPFGLTRLADDETIDVRDGERFISHVRSGASS